MGNLDSSEKNSEKTKPSIARAHWYISHEAKIKLEQIQKEKNLSQEALLDNILEFNDLLLRKTDPLFLSMSKEEKLIYAVNKFMEYSEKYPFMNTQPKDPASYDFPSCQFIEYFSYKCEDIGFICLNRKPRILIPKRKFGSYHFVQAISSQMCWKCSNLTKELEIPEKISLEEIEAHKDGITRIEFKTQSQLFNQIRETEAFRLTDYEMRMILKTIKIREEGNNSGITQIAESMNRSRPTITRFLEVYQKLDPELKVYSRYH